MALWVTGAVITLTLQFRAARDQSMNSFNRDNRYSGFKHHAKVHSFRFVTVVLAWIGIAAAFYEKPELLTGLQRAIQRSMEIVGDDIPSPWGPRIEFVFREVGGFIWLQITLVVILLRVVLSSFAGIWRFIRRRDAG